MRCIVFLLLSLFILTPFAFSGPVYDFDDALSNTAKSVLFGLKQTKQLEGKKVAVFGFLDVETKKDCTALSSAIASKIMAEMQGFKKYALDIPFTIVSRGQLDAIEAEYQMKAGDKDFFDSFEEADILITGDWQKAEDSFDLTIKVLDVEGKSIELDSLSYTINKTGMTKPLLDCLKLEVSEKPGHVPKALSFADLSIEVLDGIKAGSVLALQPVNRKEANITVGVAASLENKIANSLQRAAFAKGLSFTYRAKLRGIWREQDYLEHLKSAGVDILISVTAYQAGVNKVEASLRATGLRGEQAGKVMGVSGSIVTDIPQSYKARVKGVFAVADGSRIEKFESALRAGISSFKEISITSIMIP